MPFLFFLDQETIKYILPVLQVSVPSQIEVRILFYKVGKQTHPTGTYYFLFMVLCHTMLIKLNIIINSILSLEAKNIPTAFSGCPGYDTVM